jgi:hypothetical protein
MTAMATGEVISALVKICDAVRNTSQRLPHILARYGVSHTGRAYELLRSSAAWRAGCRPVAYLKVFYAWKIGVSFSYVAGNWG